jgi:hypothetical protein
MHPGDLVKTNTGSHSHVGKMGIVTKVLAPGEHQLWHDVRLVSVLYPGTGEELNWAEERLEVIS